MARAQATDYFHSFKFRVLAGSVNGGATPVFTGGFNSVSIPEYSVEAVEYKEGIWTFKRKFPGDVTVSDVTMTRGVVRGDTQLYSWILAAIHGQEYRADIVIHQFHRVDIVGSAVDYTNIVAKRTITLQEAIPIRVKLGADLDSVTSDISIEEIDIALEQFTLVNGT